MNRICDLFGYEKEEIENNNLLKFVAEDKMPVIESIRKKINHLQ